MEIRASEDAAHIENLEVENAKLRATTAAARTLILSATVLMPTWPTESEARNSWIRDSQKWLNETYICA